jgi:hypothetical protein
MPPYADGKRRGADADKALEWLEKGAQQLQLEEPQAAAEEEAEEVRELWYARALACVRVDQGLQEGAVVEGEEWVEEVETERYGAKTGPEFVRVVRRRANRLKHARSVGCSVRYWNAFVCVHTCMRLEFSRL